MLLSYLSPLILLSLLVGGVTLLVPQAFAQSHFSECVSGTGNSATVVVESAIPVLFDGSPLQPGDEIAIFTPDGVCAGVVAWQQGMNQAITIWADDPISEVIDGFNQGDEMQYRVWIEGLNMEVGGVLGTVSVEYDTCEMRPPLCTSTGEYQSGAIFYLNALEAFTAATDATPLSTPGEYLSAYPNPFSDQATVEVVLPTSDRVTIELVDELGRVVRRLYSGQMIAGEPRAITLETEGLMAGVYFVHVRGQGFSNILPLTHIR